MSDELLKPSLESSKPVSIMSSGALMGAAFFGGPIAVAIVAVMNSISLGRLTKEWPLIIGVLAVGAVAAYLFGNYVFDGLADARSFRLASRAAGFVSFGIVFLMYRKELRTLSTLNIKPRSPWAPLIAACLVAMALHFWILNMLTKAMTNGG